jgi:cysteine desulfurase
MGICVSTGSACDSVNSSISHVLRSISLDDEYAKGTIRISLGRDNTEEHVLQIAESIVKILKSQLAMI